MSEVTGGSSPSPAPTKSGGAPTSSAPKAPAQSAASKTSAPAVGKQPTPNAPVAPGSGKPSIGDQVKPKASAPQADQTAEAKEAARKKYKFKVDGKEWEEDLDDQEVSVRLQKALAAEKRMQEAAEYKKKFNEALEYGKTNPADAVKQLFGLDLDEWAENRIAEKFQEAMLPEHEKEKAKLQKEIERYKAQEEKARKEQEHAARSKYEQEVWQETEASMVGALNKLGLDKGVSKYVLPMMADIAEANLEYGLDLDPDMMAHQVQKNLRAVNNHLMKGLKGDSLLEHLGDDVVKEVIRAKMEKMKLKAPEARPAPPKPQPTKSEPKKSMSPSEFRRKHLFGIE